MRMSSFNADDLVILSAPGYSKVVMFHDNARATPNVTKDDDGEDNIDAALNEGRGGYEQNIYTWNISTSITAESVSGTIQLLLQSCRLHLEMNP